MAILSVSGNLKGGCAEVIDAMRRLGINGDATPNTTVLDGQLEQGCRDVIASQDRSDEAVRRLWDDVRGECGLTCAHVTISRDVKQGCVLDVLRPSACPGASSDTAR